MAMLLPAERAGEIYRNLVQRSGLGFERLVCYFVVLARLKILKTMMLSIQSDDVNLHVRDDGLKDAQVLMFSNSLGTDMRVWDLLLTHLPTEDYRIVRYDKRGHGLSDCPDAPYSIEQLVADAETVADTLKLKNINFVGLSIGGLIGQGLAAKRPDLLRSLVLMDTSAKIGTDAMWNERIAVLRKGGLSAMTEAILDRWFINPLRNNDNELSPWRNMVSRTPLEGYVGCCNAIAGADFRESTAKLQLPVMGIAGDKDAATPPLTVEETTKLCGGQFNLVEGAGHLPCVEQPAATAKLIQNFIQKTSQL